MKGLLASICAVVLVTVSAVTFPNDLYYHHHPNMALAKHQLNGRFTPPQDASERRGRHRQASPPPPRNRHGYPGRNSHRYKNGGPPPSRENYGHRFESRSYNPVQKLSYNEDGSINWSNKAVDSQDQRQSSSDPQSSQGQQEPHDRFGDPVTSRNYYYSAYDSEYDDEQYNDYYKSPNPGYNRQKRPPTSYYDEPPRNYYGQDDDEDYYDRSYYGNSRQYDRGNSYDYYGDYNEQDGRQYNRDDSYDYNSDYSSKHTQDEEQSANAQSSQDTSNEAGKKGSAGFAGSIRLAGTLPDDGYKRGDGTFYDLETHVGSCGKKNKNTEFVVAVNSEQMGEGGRNNPNCGKEVEIVGPSGKTVRATVVDDCKTCKSGGLDLSPAAFEEIGEFSHGSVPIKWKFT